MLSVCHIINSSPLRLLCACYCRTNEEKWFRQIFTVAVLDNLDQIPHHGLPVHPSNEMSVSITTECLRINSQKTGAGSIDPILPHSYTFVPPVGRNPVISVEDVKPVARIPWFLDDCCTWHPICWLDTENGNPVMWSSSRDHMLLDSRKSALKPSCHFCIRKAVTPEMIKKHVMELVKIQLSTSTHTKCLC